MKCKSLLLFTAALTISISSVGFAQEAATTETTCEDNQAVESCIDKKIEQEKQPGLIRSYLQARREHRQWKKDDPEAKQDIQDFRQFLKNLKNNRDLQQRVSRILEDCARDENQCDSNLREILEEVRALPETAQQSQAPGTFALLQSGKKAKGSFGICQVTPDSERAHKLVVANKTYKCKMYANGVVSDKIVTKRTYGPGLYTGQQSVMLACSKNALGTRNVGFSSGIGAYYGLNLGTVIGGAGICVYIGLGRSFGIYTGVDILNVQSESAGDANTKVNTPVVDEDIFP